jgi:hypothetical protein
LPSGVICASKRWRDDSRPHKKMSGADCPALGVEIAFWARERD